MPSTVFISYRRDHGAEAARLIHAELHRRKVRPFLDVIDLQPGPFDDSLLRRIEEAPAVVVILSEGSLNRRNAAEDWFFREITHAVDTSRTIIPVLMPGFHFPPHGILPGKIESIQRLQAINWSHEHFDATLNKLDGYIRSGHSSLASDPIPPAPAPEPVATGTWRSLFGWFTQANLIEHAIPTATLLGLLLFDAMLLGCIHTDAVPEWLNRSSWLWLLLFPALSVLSGWALYELRYYRFFPSYSKGKIEFYRRLARFAPDPSSWRDEKRIAYGRFVLHVLYGRFPARERETALRHHVIWVMLAHQSINVMVSFLFLGAGLLFVPAVPAPAAAWAILAAHVPIFLWIFSSAHWKRTHCNDQILLLLNQNHAELHPNLPEFESYWKIHEDAHAA